FRRRLRVSCWGSSMASLVLFIAGRFEIGWAIGAKYTEGFTRRCPSVGTRAAPVASCGLLSYALKFLPVGPAYAGWTGIGAVGTAVLGIVLFGEAATVARILCIVLIVSGIAGLKWLS